MSNDWQEGLFGCFSDIPNCIITYILPCVTYGQVHQAVAGSGCVPHAILFALCPIISCFLAGNARKQIRQKYDLKAKPLPDCLVHCIPCTAACALCQDYRELKSRGGLAK